MNKKVKVVPGSEGWLEQFNGYSNQEWVANKIYDLDERKYQELLTDASSYNHEVAEGPAIEIVEVS